MIWLQPLLSTFQEHWEHIEVLVQLMPDLIKQWATPDVNIKTLTKIFNNFSKFWKLYVMIEKIGIELYQKYCTFFYSTFC